MTTAVAIQLFAEYVAAHRDWNYERAIEHLVSQGLDESTAQQTVVLTPIAFGRMILVPLGVELSNELISFRSDGSIERSEKLDRNDVYRTAFVLGARHAQHPAFEPIAQSSSEFDGVNQALHAGHDPADLVLGPVAMFLEPATPAGARIAQDHIVEAARKVTNAPRPTAQTASKSSWWKFW